MKLKEVNSKLDNYTKAIGQGIINQHIKDMIKSLSKDKEAHLNLLFQFKRHFKKNLLLMK